MKHITENLPSVQLARKCKVRAQLDLMILEKIEQGKLNGIIARCADFYDATGSNSVLMELVYKNLAKNKKAQWLFNDRMRHSFTYVPDAAKGTAMLGNTKEAYNQVWNLPTDGNAMTGEDWIKLFANEMGKADKYSLIPAWMVKIAGLFVPVMEEIFEMRYQYDRDYFFDSQKFEKYFNQPLQDRS
jgi:nucleoside-diphosphate-sugar epimerase